MIDLTITIQGTDAALAALDRVALGELTQPMANAAANEAVLPKLRTYPPPARKPYPFVSAKQRRYVMASIRSGAIVVPYARTGGLASSWEIQPASDGVLLTTAAPAAPFVVGDSEQAQYHKGTWATVEDVARQTEDDAALAATAAIVDAIGDAA